MWKRIKKIWRQLVSRLIDMANRMKAEQSVEVELNQRQSIEKFRQFYKTEYYQEFKLSIQQKLDTLDRQSCSDPGKLVLLQGERNALIAILDDLNTKEKRANSQIKNKQ